MSHELNRLAARLFNAPLLVLPDVAETIAENLGDRFSAAAAPLQARVAIPDADEEPYTVDNGVATLAVRGELVNRGSFMNSLSGLTSYDALQAALRQAAADPRVTSVILDMDSPGGEAAGAMETAAEVRALSKIKPVTAYVNSLAASAGYAIAAGAKDIVVTPSSTVGAIGVVWMHLDRSQAMKERGVKPTLLHAGAYKIDGHSLGALDDGARERIQASINDTYSLFVESVGKHRPKLGAEGARATEAGLYMGQKAVDAGLADRVATLSQVLKARSATSPFSGLSLSTESTADPGEDVAAAASGRVDNDQSDASEASMADAEALAAARTETATATAARIKAILGCEGAKAFPTLAARLAYESDMPGEQAVAQLADALADRPAAAAEVTGSRSASVPRLGVVTADAGGGPERSSQEEIDAMHSAHVVKLNATLPERYRPRS